jgi:hypothetical protein
MLELLIEQITTLAWIRCAIEEGTTFTNNHTGEQSFDEIEIYTELKKQSGTFDLPAAKCTPNGVEKNTLEVLGNLVINNTNPEIAQLITTPEFKQSMRTLVEKIRNS